MLLKKEDCYSDDINPDGISKPIDNLYNEVWERGYYCETKEGTWYELYVNNQIKKNHPKVDFNIKEEEEFFKGYKNLYIDDYEEYNQITFFQSIYEEKHTFIELTNYFS